MLLNLLLLFFFFCFLYIFWKTLFLHFLQFVYQQHCHRRSAALPLSLSSPFVLFHLSPRPELGHGDNDSSHPSRLSP